ncbi:MAG: hypothetical protein PHX78_08635 [bacterium]|nr:hypothetical protein [bacterium]
MTKYRCKVCGYIYDSINIDGRDQIPEKCPVCGAFQSAFLLIPPSEVNLGIYFNLFQPGWWALHFTGISLVYIIGRLIWHGMP